MKGMAITAVIIILMGTYLVLGSDNVSGIIEKYSVENIKEPGLEKISFYNIQYMDLTGKSGRCLDLIDKYDKKYEDNGKYAANLLLIEAGVRERNMEISRARELYGKYIEKYPDAKDIDNVKEKLKEIKSGF
jgi:hypothetical protein